MITDATLLAYQRWANSYPPIAHNPLMRAEERAMLDRWPMVAGKRVLDLACGSGRYTRRLAQGAPGQLVAMDFCMPMLAQVSASAQAGAQAGARVCADMMRLPFAAAAFDIVICGLALGHSSDARGWMAEVARVLSFGGVLLYSDFHPEAARAGLTRSFRDEHGETFTVPHRCHDLSIQRLGLAGAGLQLEALHEIRVGEELCEPFPGSDQFYRTWHGLPIVVVVRARKDGG